MELDTIKDLWQKENPTKTPEITLDKQKEIRMPLEKIKRNMQFEFWLSIAFLPLFIFYFFQTDDLNNRFYFLIIILSFFAVIGYYFLKFYRLYNIITHQQFSTYHNLLNLRYELILNTELYKSYYVASTVLLLSFFIIMFSKNQGYVNLFLFSMSLLICIGMMYVIGRVWLKEMYGKHIIQISKMIDHLSDEKSDFPLNRLREKDTFRFKLAEKSRAYFIKKFPRNGTFINQLFWIILSLILLLLFSFSTGFIIGYMGLAPSDLNGK